MFKYASTFGVAGFFVSAAMAHAADLTVDIGPLPTSFYYQHFELDYAAKGNIGGYPVGLTSVGEGDVYFKNNFASTSGGPNYSADYDFTLSSPVSFSGRFDSYYVDTDSLSLFKGTTLIQSISGNSTINISALSSGDYTLGVSGSVYPGSGLGQDRISFEGSAAVSAVPLPATLPLLGSAIAILAGAAMKKSRRSKAT